MSWNNDNVDPSLLQMISDLQDGNLSEEDRSWLNARLKRDAQARKFYHAMMNLHVHLDQACSGGQDLIEMPKSTDLTGKIFKSGSTVKSRTRSFWWVAIAASFAVGVLFNPWAFRDREPLAELDPEVETVFDGIDGVAVLTHAIGVQWDSAMPHQYRERDALPKGTLLLEQGFAQIEFFSGAVVILEAPVELELLSSDFAKFAVGKLHAYVPEPARGFTIEAPGFSAVDLGTEFAMGLDQNGNAEVHVIDGEVSLRNKNGDTIQDLLGGQAVRTTGQPGSFETIAINTTAFVGRKQIAKFVRKDFRANAESWRQQRDRWAGDPDTVVYFDFENQKRWDRQLKSAKPGAPEGAIVGAQWTQGRWPGKGAI